MRGIPLGVYRAYALKMNEKWEKKAFEPERQDQYGPYYHTAAPLSA